MGIAGSVAAAATGAIAAYEVLLLALLVRPMVVFLKVLGSLESM